MSAEFSTGRSGRLVIAVLALSLIAMLVASLMARFSSPGLVTRHAASETAMPGAQGADDVGRLMQQAARNPDDASVQLELAERLMRLGSWEGAENFASRALALAPEDTRTRYLLGVIRHNQGRHAEAATLLEEVLQRKDSAPVRYSLGVLYLHYLNQAARGIEHLSAGLHAPDADESLKAAIRQELEKAPLPEADAPEADVAAAAGAPAPETAKATGTAAEATKTPATGAAPPPARGKARGRSVPASGSAKAPGKGGTARHGSEQPRP